MGLFSSIFGNENKTYSNVPVPTADEFGQLQAKIAEARQTLINLNRDIQQKTDQLIELDELTLLQSFSLYQPVYDFVNSEQYKNKLDEIRERQKEMIKNGTATTGAINWTVDGSVAKGRKMVGDTQKLLLRAFNSECEFLTWKVKYNNFESCKKRMFSAYSTIMKLGKTMSIEISPDYYSLKIEELHLALEYQLMKQREKEHQRELREQQKEETALLKEIEETRRKIEKEQSHYLNALATAKKQLAVADTAELAQSLSEKIEEIEAHLVTIDKNLSEVDYREANQKAGYVYVISNIGSFGENVFKIGMTRRLDPMERIHELGGASVPFNFDVHAMIFSDDAPKLEAALHRAFEHRKLNLINSRREFFYVGIEEIEAVVKQNYDKSVDFVRYPDAEQFRESKKMRQINKNLK